MTAPALILSLSVGAVSTAGGVSWQETLSPQFQIKHESKFLPTGLLMELGKMHNRLRMDLAMFAPWMAKERIKIHVYRTKESYVMGEFHPPTWSNGVAFYRLKTIATYELEERARMDGVLAHEMTHLLFESYWGEEKKTPPVWLNEGLSMLEEASDPKEPEKSDWFQAMDTLAREGTIPFEKFLAINPTKHIAESDKDNVTLWYVQAYSVVHFLYRRHSRLQFLNFCRELRAGLTLEKALWKIYRYQSFDAFELAWKRWLKLPEIRAKFKGGSAAVSAHPEPARGGKKVAKDGKSGLRQVGFGNFGYHGLVPD